MAVGAEFHTESGVVQIDDKAAVLCLRYAGSSTVTNRHPASQHTSSNIAMTVDITVTAETPLIALRGEADGSSFGVIATVRNGNTWTFRVIGMAHAPRFSYFVFDRPAASASGAGFEVYDANGKIVFSSLYRPLSVVGFAYTDNGGNPGSISLPGGRQYATMFNASISRQEWENHGTDDQVDFYWSDRLALGSVFGSRVDVGDYPIAGGQSRGGGEPLPIQGDLGGWGSASGLVAVDVTGLVSVVTPASPRVSVSPSSQTAQGPGSGTTITDAVTATASGGSGSGYQYQWLETLSDARVTPYGATNTRALRTQAVNQAAGSNIVTRWQCRVTDSNGAIGFSDEVTMNHVQAGISIIPAPMTFTDISLTTNDDSGITNLTTSNVTGINQPIILRFERYDLTGNLSTATVVVQTSLNGSAWAEVGRFNALQSGLAFVDLTIQPNTSVRYYVHATTTSGRRTGSMRIAVWNLSNPNATGTISSKNATLVVDADDNFNKQLINPDPISFTNFTPSTNDDTAFGVPRIFQITGINQPITLAIGRFNEVSTGNISKRFLRVHTGPTADGPWTLQREITGQGAFNFPVTNGTWVHLSIEVSTTSGRATLYYDAELRNITASTVLHRFFLNGVVDADDNFNKAPVLTVNPVKWADINVVTDANIIAGSNAARTITGQSQSVNLRFTMTAGSSTFSGGDFYLYKNGVRTRGANGFGLGYWVDVDVVAGDQVYFYYDGYTAQGRKNLDATITVQNTSAPGAWQLLDTFQIKGTVDNQNVWNMPVVTPNPMSWPAQNWSSSSNAVNGAYLSNGPTIAGINQTIRVKFTITSLTSNLSAGTWAVTNIQGGSHTNLAENISMLNGASTEFSVTNGTNLTFKMNALTNSGRRSASGTMAVTNVTTGESLGSFNFGVTVDQNNTYNIVNANPFNLGNMTVSTNDNLGWSNLGGPVQVTGTTVPITLYAGISARTGGVDAGTVFVVKAPTSNGPWTTVTGMSTANGGVDAVEWTMNPGEWFYLHTSAETHSGKKTAAFTVGIHNASNGYNVIGSSYVTITVDADNNYNVARQTLDPLPYTSYYNYESGGGSYGEVKPGPGPITGINVPVKIRMTVSQYFGNLDNHFARAWVNSQVQGEVSGGVGWGNGSIEFTVNNGQYIEFQHGGSNSTYGTAKSESYVVTLTNVNTGQVIASWQVDGYVGYGVA